LAALEKAMDKDCHRILWIKDKQPIGEEEMRVLCAVLGRPRVAGRLTDLRLGCPIPATTPHPPSDRQQITSFFFPKALQPDASCVFGCLE
jgi:hypothetical protein